MQSNAALRSHLVRQLLELPVLLLAWLVAWPLARLCRRDPALVTVIGRGDGQFSDNAKYFFIHGAARLRDHAVVFLTENRSTRAALLEHGAAVVLYPSFAAFRLLLRTGAVVADSAEWVRGGRYQLSVGAKRLQLWHGVPLKSIEKVHLESRLSRHGVLAQVLYRLYIRFYARYPHYDLVVSTSRFFTAAAFEKSFDTAAVIESGYPRNDVLVPRDDHFFKSLAAINCDQAALARVRDHRHRGHRVVLYAPTFRTHGSNPDSEDVLDYAALDAFAAENRLCVVLKLHPLLAGRRRIKGLPHIIEYDPCSDIYPALAAVDLLVTDYSSIYFDFLLLARPIVFFPYDLDEYLRRERHLLFDYRELTPGPLARTQQELQREILQSLDGPDTYAAERARVRSLAFDHAAGDGAERIWSQLRRILDGARPTVSTA